MNKFRSQENSLYLYTIQMEPHFLKILIHLQILPYSQTMLYIHLQILPYSQTMLYILLQILPYSQTMLYTWNYLQILPFSQTMLYTWNYRYCPTPRPCYIPGTTYRYCPTPRPCYIPGTIDTALLLDHVIYLELFFEVNICKLFSQFTNINRSEKILSETSSFRKRTLFKIVV